MGRGGFLVAGRGGGLCGAVGSMRGLRDAVRGSFESCFRSGEEKLVELIFQSRLEWADAFFEIDA